MAGFISGAATSIVSAAIGAVGVIYAANVGLIGTNRQMDVKMVEIAVGILAKEPKDNIAPAREWAVDVIDHYAQVPLSPEARLALVNNKAIDYSQPIAGYTDYQTIQPGYTDYQSLPAPAGK